MTAVLILQDLVLLSGESGGNMLVWGHQTGYHKMQVCTNMYDNEMQIQIQILGPCTASLKERITM